MQTFQSENQPGDVRLNKYISDAGVCSRREADRLITEDVARSLIGGGNTAICLAANAIVTPSAWDLFKQKGIEVIRK